MLKYRQLLDVFVMHASLYRGQLNTVLHHFAMVQFFYIVCVHYNFLLLHFSVTLS